MTHIVARIAFSAFLAQSIVSADPTQEQGQEFSWDCPGSGYLPFRRELLVSTGELAALIESSDVTVIHVGSEPSGPGRIRRATYGDGHIPGAFHLRAADLKGAGETLRPAEGRWPALAALGITPGRRVVLYDTGVGLEAAAAFVALESVGLAEHAALLDGQWVKWVSEGRPLCRWGEELGASDLEPAPSSVAVTLTELKALLQEAGEQRPAVTLLDGRAGLGFAEQTLALRAFARLPWTENFASFSLPVLKSEAELRHRWASVPSRSGHRIMVAARHWREAAHLYFVARLLGYRVQFLDGSIEDLNESVTTLERGS